MRRAFLTYFAFGLGLIALCLPGPGTAIAQEARPLLLKHLTTLDGLPQGTVYASLQDTTGFMWFGTEDGLVQYDGHEIRRYASDPNIKGGLPGNFVFAIVEDAQTNVWVALKGAGVARWNRSTDTFTIYHHDASNPNSLASDFVRTLLIDSGGRVWIGTLDAGVDVLDPHSNRFHHLRHQAGTDSSLISDQVYALFEDSRKEIWIGTDAGIDRWEFGRKGLTRSSYLKNARGILPDHEVHQMVDGSDGTVWVGTFESGIYRVNDAGDVLANFGHQSAPQSLSSNEVHALLNDTNGALWIGTAEGLDSLDRLNGHLSHYVHDKADSESLTDSFIMSLYKDPSGLVWIGTRAGGVNRWNPQSWELGGSNPKWLDGKLVTAFADASDQDLWVGTLGGGLYHFNPRSGEAVKIKAILDPTEAIGDERVMSLRRDRRGALWIGTWAGGIKKLETTGNLVSIPVKQGDPRALSAAGIVTIYESPQGLLWIGTHGGGANILDPTTGLIKQLPYDAAIHGATSSENVTSFLEDNSGMVWIGTESGGLDLAQPDGTVVRVFRHDPANPSSLSSNIVYALTLDSAGRIWASTDGGGLNLIVGASSDPASIHFERFSRAQGLSSDTIYAALPDTKGQLWLSGNAGLMRFDPVSHSVKTFHREHGLQGEEFNSFAYYRTQDGRLCFGGTDGINVFDPAKLSVEVAAPRIALTGIEVLGAPLPTAAPKWQLHEVPLDYRANVVSFDFAALDFKSPTRNRLAYRVSGVTDQWIDLNAQRRVTLTNLGPGDHILEVRAANADSVWSTAPFRLVIHKGAAPWQSVAAYTFYALLFTVVILWAVRVQRMKLRGALVAQQHLESEVRLRTKELSEANQQLTIASEAKSNFLARMGHELRTPMNGVVGMTELLARAPLPAALTRQVNTIRASAQTLLQILNDLLDLSKAQAGKIVLESIPLDVTQLMEETAAMFCGAVDAKGLTLIVCPEPTARYQISGDPLRIRQILMNLIGNAIKFTERGEIVVSCDFSPDTDPARVCITVTDTGVGIAPAAIGKIFDAFTQADESTTRRFGGTGLGLSICQELVELMGGTIRVDSQVDGGSTFTVLLPLTLRESKTGLAPPGAQTLVIFTRRLAVAESLRRYAALLGWGHRISDFSRDASVRGDEIVVVDADSEPAASEMFGRPASGQPALFIAGSVASTKLQLESRVGTARLLRSPFTRAELRSALGIAGGSVEDTTLVERIGGGPITLGKHVLIVEDDSVNATVAEGYLSALGCTSVWVPDGASAVTRYAHDRFDLILMDLNMPGLDGYETASQIRRAESGSRRVPIIAMTANNAGEFPEACRDAGMDDILAKPCTLAQCAEVLLRWSGHGGASEYDAESRSALHLRLARVDGTNVAGYRDIGGGAGNALYAKLVSLFQASVTDGMSELNRALAGGDWPLSRAIAHKLKGAAANVGALGFSECLGEIETCCSGDGTGAIGLYETLALALPFLMAELAGLSLRESA